MASALQKLLRRSTFARAISTSHCPAAPSRHLPPIHILDPHIHQPGLLGQLLGPPTTTKEGSAQPCPPPIFPKFPLGLCSGPIYVNVSEEPDVEGAESDDADGAMWADSVKKKRKKKMNKHKYKKLRKRLRRKT